MQGASDDFNVSRTDGDAYVDHLVAVNESQEVIASENIYNQFGVLLIAKGTRLNHRMGKLVHQHKLHKPLDVQVELKGNLTSANLLDAILEYIGRHEELREIHRKSDYGQALRHYCLSREIHPLLRQKLSVMADRMPESFDHSLFCGWASGLVAKEMGLSNESCSNAFLCGLCHDIGLLHIPADALTKGPLSEQHWRALQSHVVIGAKIVEELGLYSTEIGKGILEHHERMDRTGYPSRKPAGRLGLLGQVVAGVDLMHNLCVKELAASERPIRGTAPYIKIHHGAYRKDVHDAILRILKRTEGMLNRHQDESLLALQQRVVAMNKRLSELAADLSALLLNEGLLSKTADGQAVLSVSTAILETLTRSGLDSQEMQAWLNEQPDPDDPSFAEMLSETDAMQYELLWLFKRLVRSFEEFLEPADKRTSGKKPDFTPLYPLFGQLQRGLQTALAG